MLCFPPARVAVAQSSSLSLFTNRDAELEQRAMLLKRLAFTIYSSEVDQYQKYLPDIQGNEGADVAPVEGLRLENILPTVYRVYMSESEDVVTERFCVCPQSVWWRACVCPRCPSCTLRSSCSSGCCCCACPLSTSRLCGPP